MKKLFITLAFILTASVSAFAGVLTGESENDNFTWDVRLGCNFSNFYARLNSGAKGKVGGMKSGFSLSTNVRYYPIEQLAIETGIGLQQRGSKDSTLEGYYNGTRFTSWYLEVPAVACLQVAEFDESRAFFDFGLYGGYGVGGKWTSRLGEGRMFGADGLLNRGDFGLVLGISGIFSDIFYAGFRYQQSILQISNDYARSEYGRLFNHSFSFRIGVIL